MKRCPILAQWEGNDITMQHSITKHFPRLCPSRHFKVRVGSRRERGPTADRDGDQRSFLPRSRLLSPWVGRYHRGRRDHQNPIVPSRAFNTSLALAIKELRGDIDPNQMLGASSALHNTIPHCNHRPAVSGISDPHR